MPSDGGLRGYLRHDGGCYPHAYAARMRNYGVIRPAETRGFTTDLCRFIRMSHTLCRNFAFNWSIVTNRR